MSLEEGKQPVSILKYDSTEDERVFKEAGEILIPISRNCLLLLHWCNDVGFKTLCFAEKGLYSNIEFLLENDNVDGR